MRKVVLLVLLCTCFSVFGEVDFVQYYNKKNNWSSKVIGNGVLNIDEVVVLKRTLCIPKTVEINIHGKGALIGGSYSLTFNGDPENPGENDPQVVYKKFISSVVTTIITSLLLD